MKLARLLAERWVYLVDVLPGRVLRARAVSTGDFLRAGVATVVLRTPPAPAGEDGLDLAPPPPAAADLDRDLQRIRLACRAVEGACEVPEGWDGRPGALPAAGWEAFALVEDEGAEDLDAGRLWMDRLGPQTLLQIGMAVIRESAGASGVAQALTTFHGG